MIRFSETLDENVIEEQTASQIMEKASALKHHSSLEDAMRIIRKTGEAHIPVVSDGDGKLIGQVHEHEVNFTYHKAILQAADENEEDEDQSPNR